ncbi:MAG: hypothetical protein HW421_3692 [Ignavibacteria bacterium]|nr:hypothetical protein [Ignavibacteria bacterium]
MSTLNLKLPKSLHKQAKNLAKKEKTTVNQLVSSALAEKISVIMAEEYIETRAKRASKEKFNQALNKVADIDAELFDKLSNSE